MHKNIVILFFIALVVVALMPNDVAGTDLALNKREFDDDSFALNKRGDEEDGDFALNKRQDSGDSSSPSTGSTGAPSTDSSVTSGSNATSPSPSSSATKISFTSGSDYKLAIAGFVLLANCVFFL